MKLFGFTEMVLIFLIVAVPYIVTLYDIMWSNFKDPSNKLVWFLFVFFTPFIGIFFYWTIGRKQRLVGQ